MTKQEATKLNMFLMRATDYTAKEGEVFQLGFQDHLTWLKTEKYFKKFIFGPL